MNIHKFFKYRAINKNLIDSLVNGYLYCAPPASLNDPFDCQVDIKKSANYASSKLSGMKRDFLIRMSQLDVFIDEIQQRMTGIGICSFSLTLEEPLLWSHYADEHRGICLLFEFPEDFLLNEANEIVGAGAISYGKNPLSDWLAGIIPDQIEDGFYDYFTTELLKKVLIIKAIGWGYEKECRIIREKTGPFWVPKKFLTQVCFGMNISVSDKKLVRKIIDSAGYTVDYFQIEKKECDFGIKAIKL